MESRGRHFRYRLGGHIVSFERALSGAVAPIPAGARTDIVVRTFRGRGTAPRCTGWFHAWRDPGARGERMRFGSAPGGYLIHVLRLGKFFVASSGTRIDAYPAARVGKAAFQHLLLDQVLPLALGLRGDLVLHASAVATDGSVIAFVGPSGRGKSTLAAQLAAQGAQVLTDDCLVLRPCGSGWAAFPFDQGVRLSAASADATLRDASAAAVVAEGSPKRRVLRHPSLRFRRRPGVLGAIVVLEPRRRGAQAPVLERLAPRLAMMAVLPQTFFFEVRRRVALRRQFEQLTRLVGAVPVWRAALPAKLSALPEAGERLRALCRGQTSRVDR